VHGLSPGGYGGPQQDRRGDRVHYKVSVTVYLKR
jgi:hypothetical protein